MAGVENPCSCGSGESYQDCCEPYHIGEKAAPTAVALMRSRYAAFVCGRVDYLVATTLPAKRTADLENHCRLTCESVHWITLDVLGTTQGGPADKTGRVEFKASYIAAGNIRIHHECSRFRRERGKWYYVDAV